MSVLFKRPAGSFAVSVYDFVKEPMRSLSFLQQEIEVDQSITVEEVSDGLDLNRLLDNNDDYESLLYNSKRRIIYKDGEYKLGTPSSEHEVSDEPS